ncbi:sugar ABC transporter ATP-binding protein [Bacillus sp. FJAT-50079]|uniref:sugar ABC transporter ATP-binding protein n=1 Tax=Bacillus sp. FJAT-50079 TaxID=2833577 RepID=UPI001BC90F33|nr:sugar ABC transporter ATP-binding protein [Bacillus sp. FJAT-50079]MBS4206533.1 sugar ABC transporter ATP-binding protein [Bacillus sp. FJAT-50079]
MSDQLPIEMKSVSKSFPGVKALQAVDFQLASGEIHGLLGENGAGKSTLMKVLAGLYEHDRGEIFIHGQKQEKLTPKLLETLGVQFIHQERLMIQTFTVAQTLFLGNERTTRFLKLARRKAMEKEAEKIIEYTVGSVIPGNKLISELTVGELQLLQISRALMKEPKVIVFDEPTAVLAKKEAEKLFSIIQQLKERGLSIIYISHYFKEVLALCDRITVLRDGKKVATESVAGLTVEDLVYKVAGKQIEHQFPNKDWEYGKTLLSVEDLHHKHDFRNISFDIRRGEIVGLTGLMGSGYTSVGKALFDQKAITHGKVVFNGKEVNRLRPEKAVSLGIAYVPEDRRNLGIIKSMSVKENITLTNLRGVSDRLGLIKNSKEKTAADAFINELSIRTPNSDEEINGLSGGNQQKAVIAKWLNSEAKLYILNQPTSAVDVGAKAEIYQLIGKMAKEGAAVLLISQDLQELEGLCDRTFIMYRGEVTEELSGIDMTAEKMMISLMGGDKHATSSVG